MYTVSVERRWESEWPVNQGKTPPDQGDELPEGSTVIQQVPLAWLWSSTPWMIGLLVLFVLEMGLFASPLVATAFTLVILVPRYLMSRKTAYILSDEVLIYQRGGIMSTRRYNIPISGLRDAKARYGLFGRALGYQSVDLVLEKGATASLSYVPINEDVAAHLRHLIDASGSGPEDTGSSDEPRSPDPGESDGEKPPTA
jgi:hypothetical protein